MLTELRVIQRCKQQKNFPILLFSSLRKLGCLGQQAVPVNVPVYEQAAPGVYVVLKMALYASLACV